MAKNGTVTLTLSLGLERYGVPNLAGKTVDEATALLTAQHLTLGNQSQAYSDKIDAGKIISSTPPTGTPLRRDSAVAVVVSKGAAPVSVPTFKNLQLAAAQSLAASKHLSVTQTGQQYSMTVPLGAVISQATQAGTSVPRNTAIGVVVSQGPPLVAVPNVIDKKASQAIKILQGAGFKVQIQSAPNPKLDRVIDQSKSGTAPYGSTIVITIV